MRARKRMGVTLVRPTCGWTGPRLAGVGSLVFALVLAAGPVTAENSSGQTKAVDSAAPAATRPPQTRSEVERALDLVRRQREELVVRIGDKEPTEKQRSTLEDLETLIRTLEEKLEWLQAIEKQKAEVAGDSFKGRWIRVRSALQDATRYDL